MENERLAASPASRDNMLLRYFKDMPIVFPLIGLFLLGLTVLEAWNFLGDDSVSRLYWLRPLVMLVYFLCWAGICLRSKKAGIAFVVLTILNVSFHLFGPDILWRRALGNLLFEPIPINLLFAFLLLFFFRRLS